MTHDDDAGEDALDRINLHAWRVPPPSADDRSAILARALAPAAPTKRARMPWMFVALAIGNVVLAAIIVIVIVIVPRPAPTTVTVQPAGGGGSVDAETSKLLRRLAQEQRELERRLADVQQLRAAVEQLSERVRQCEQADRREPPGPKPRREPPAPSELGGCDEVGCVLSNYEGACCAKFRRGAQPTRPAPSPALPDTLTREMISSAIAAIRAQVLACDRDATAKGTVKVRVRVRGEGRVTSVLVEKDSEPGLGVCVASVVQKATFAKTHHGGSFSYPFVFGASR